MPSFGLRIPNGERVPCSSSTSEEMAAGCSRQGYCLGLGHHQCDGVQPDDVTLESTTEETRLVSLNPFGDDFKTANYEWYSLCLSSSCFHGSYPPLCFLFLSFVRILGFLFESLCMLVYILLIVFFLLDGSSLSCSSIY